MPGQTVMKQSARRRPAWWLALGNLGLPGPAHDQADSDRLAPSEWHGPGAAGRARRGFQWRTLLWALVFPPRRHRIGLTVPGIFLMVVSIGIGTAAYNTASNILFITLSLLLACLLLSGLLSWFNFTGVCWRLLPQGPWRVGHEALVLVEVRNRKRWLPSYSLWFELSTQPRRPPVFDRAEKEMKVREILSAAEKFVTRGRVYLRDRIEPRGEAGVEWVVKPSQRGEALVELASVGSLFPFGFLRKNIGAALKQRVLVWPAQISYQWLGGVSAHGGSTGQRASRIGRGDDLVALRKYSQGDSHRLIHWKASARLGQLMIRQFAAESHDGYVLVLDAPAEVWTRPEQFELLCSLVGTMAEDLFATGRLRGVAMKGRAWVETRRVRDMEAVLNQLARLQPWSLGVGGVDSAGVDLTMTGEGTRPTGGKAGRNVITFAPDGARGVAAYVDGRQIASA